MVGTNTAKRTGIVSSGLSRARLLDEGVASGQSGAARGLRELPMGSLEIPVAFYRSMPVSPSAFLRRSHHHPELLPPGRRTVIRFE